MMVTREALKEMEFGVDELAFQVCRDEMTSGEAFYTALQCFVEAKLAQLKGEVI